MFIKNVLSLAIILISFSKNAIAQVNKLEYSSYKKTADSIVNLYYGKQELKYITIDSSDSYYRTFKINGSASISQFLDDLLFDPEMFCFQYLFIHPTFNKDTLLIKFYVDKTHRIMPGMAPAGLFDMAGSNELKIISREEALKIAKKIKIKKPLDKFEIELGWDEYEATLEDYKKYNLTKNIKEIVKGKIVWRIKSQFRKIPNDEKPYSEIYIIDAVTGKIISIEHENLILG